MLGFVKSENVLECKVWHIILNKVIQNIFKMEYTTTNAWKSKQNYDRSNTYEDINKLKYRDHDILYFRIHNLLPRFILPLSFFWHHFNMVFSRFVQDSLYIQFSPSTPRFNKLPVSIFTTLALLIYITKVSHLPWPCKSKFLTSHINNLLQSYAIMDISPKQHNQKRPYDSTIKRTT